MMRLEVDRVKSLLRDGEVDVLGLLPGASNYTFAVTVAEGRVKMLAVYKPRAGEMPLWDFPDGTLYRREIAAYELSEALGWGLVPPTLEREGPEGIGSMQLFIQHDPTNHYLTLMPAHADVFRRVALFDHVLNNADRKSGHCLLEDGTGRIWVVDHGVCFHPLPKLRTVIWDFAGQPISADLAAALARADVAVLEPWLTGDEVEAARARIDGLLREGVFPNPPEDRRPYPWPPV
ncbi:MAG: SCO1664 family protein [Actinomycetota bacterium]